MSIDLSALPFSFDPATLAILAGLVFLIVDRTKFLIPDGSQPGDAQSVRQNNIVRLYSVALGVALGLLALPAVPGAAVTYTTLLCAAAEGFVVGSGVTVAVKGGKVSIPAILGAVSTAAASETVQPVAAPSVPSE